MPRPPQRLGTPRPPRPHETRSPARSGRPSAVGYLRRSTDRQEQSIPDQRAAVERYAEEHGLTLVRCYIDDAISGTSTVGRRAFLEMIETACGPARDFSSIVVYDVKRFGRIDNDEAGYYRHLLKQCGVEVLYASEGFNGDGTDDLLRPVKQWQARQESKDLSKVTIRGLLSKTEAPRSVGAGERGGLSGGESGGGGWWMGGAPPFGYDLAYESQSGDFLFVLRYMRDGTKRMLDEAGQVHRTLGRDETVAVSRRDRCRLLPSEPDRVETIRRIFRMYAEERRGFKAIADRLNRDGVPTARGPEWSEHYGGRWSISTVRAILVNPAYRGAMVWNRRTDGRFHRISQGRAVERKGVIGRRLESNDERDWIVSEGAHEGLVDERVWAAAQAIMKERPASAAQRGVCPRTGIPVGEPVGITGSGSRARFLLSGLATCARCGSRYEGHIQRNRRAGGEREKVYGYACGGYIRHGRSVCRLGSIAQERIEGAVIAAVVGAYEGYRGEDGAGRIMESLLGAVGADHKQVAKESAKIKARLAKIESTSRRLLDNLSDTNRPMVDARLVELDREREQLVAKQRAMGRSQMSEAHARALATDLQEFVESLEHALLSGPLDSRQAALRRCVDCIKFDHEAMRIEIVIRALPTCAGGPDGGDSITLAVAMPSD